MDEVGIAIYNYRLRKYTPVFEDLHVSRRKIVSQERYKGGVLRFFKEVCDTLATPAIVRLLVTSRGFAIGVRGDIDLDKAREIIDRVHHAVNEYRLMGIAEAMESSDGVDDYVLGEGFPITFEVSRLLYMIINEVAFVSDAAVDMNVTLGHIKEVGCYGIIINLYGVVRF